QALLIDPNRRQQIEPGLNEAMAEKAKVDVAATEARVKTLGTLLSLAATGLALTAFALVLAFAPRRRADLLYKLGRAAPAARIYARIGDSDRALRICRSQAIVKPDDNEIRRVAADIQFDSRDATAAAE